MANTVSGTFSGTGSSDSVAANNVAISAVFAGTATVNVQWDPLRDGSFSTVEAFTASFTKVYQGPSVPIRLNCSAHTNNVTYSIQGY